MVRASFVAILALIVSGSGAIACTNSPDDFGGSSSGDAPTKTKRRGPNAASGDIGGDPETPSEEPLSGTPDPSGDEEPAAPPNASDPPPADPDPNVDPDPNPNPIPAGSFAIGTQLVNTANLNIREGADTTFAIITTAPKDSILTVVSVSGANGWVNVSWNGNVGWSSKAYLAIP